MLKKIANVISVIFHPLLMPSIGIIIIFNTGIYFSLLPYDVKRLIFYLILIITFILPIAVIPFLKMQKLIADYKMSNIKERLLPLLIISILYLTGYLFTSNLSIIPQFIQNFFLSSVIAVFLTFIITYKWKISIHMVGIGGLTGIILALIKFHPINLHLYIIFAFLLSGIIGSTRLYLNEHKPLQVYSGFLLGFVVVFFIGIIF